MSPKPSPAFVILPFFLLMTSLFPERAAFSLEAYQSPVQTAGRRSQNAAKTIRVVTGLPEDEAIPMELFERAQAIGVFPDVVRMNLLFSQGMKGYGVISSHRADGWSLPAYYRFGSSTFSLKIAGGKSFDLIMLFMNKET
ncbi:MAG TPA: hypothetical protein VEV81_15905, partial [Pyrinomonadaceae bacterium]|nr:hypothetical protein [Pyrinomonadaceae bacterium]